MSLVPLEGYESERLLDVRCWAPNGLQYATFATGRTQRERYALLLESSLVGFVGCVCSYLLSFAVGGFLATLLGTAFLFWGPLGPQFKAAKRNWDFLQGRRFLAGYDDGYGGEYGDGVRSSSPPRRQRRRNGGSSSLLYGALYLGRIDDLCVVEDEFDSAWQEYDVSEFAEDYTAERDELDLQVGRPYLLRVRCTDNDGDGDGGRTLQCHSKLSEEYLDNLQIGMPVMAVLASADPRFAALEAVSDLYVPDAACYVGDYPYLSRPDVEEFLDANPDVWNELIGQGRGPAYDVVDDTAEYEIKEDKKTDVVVLDGGGGGDDGKVVVDLERVVDGPGTSSTKDNGSNYNSDNGDLNDVTGPNSGGGGFARTRKRQRG